MPSSDFKLLKKRSVGALCPKRFAGQALPAVTASAQALIEFQSGGKTSVRPTHDENAGGVVLRGYREKIVCFVIAETACPDWS